MMMMVKLVFMVVMVVSQLLMLPMLKVLHLVVHNFNKLIATGKLNMSQLLLAKDGGRGNGGRAGARPIGRGFSPLGACH